MEHRVIGAYQKQMKHIGAYQWHMKCSGAYQRHMEHFEAFNSEYNFSEHINNKYRTEAQTSFLTLQSYHSYPKLLPKHITKALDIISKIQKV